MNVNGELGTCHCDVILEETLGHVTHGQNLRRLMPAQHGFQPMFIPVAFDIEGWKRHLPGFSNWTVRAGLRARRGLRALPDRHPRDALFVHTQVPAVFLGSIVERTPTVISLDATPKQYDELGEHYAHVVGPRWIERVKDRLNQRRFHQAAHIVTWASWTKSDLVERYGIDAGKISVVPPGVDTQRWLRGSEEPVGDETPIRILFVGGNFVRKGGDDLLAAFSQLRSRHGDSVELHLVTPTALEAPPGVTVHSSMTPNSPDLISLYRQCHIFCLPTRGDCLPMVLPEAAAAGLAVVSTRVGAIPEIVRDGETGLLVTVGDIPALTSALELLVTDAELRHRLADGATALVRAEHDAAKNAVRLVELIREVGSVPH